MVVLTPSLGSSVAMIHVLPQVGLGANPLPVGVGR